MKSIAIRFLLVVVGLSAASRAQAIVVFSYSPVTGEVRVTNDQAGSLAAIVLKSGSPGLGEFPLGQALTGTPLQIPGAQLDTGDQPFAISYLNFPVGSYSLGNVVTPCTPRGNLSLEFYFPALTSPLQLAITPLECYGLNCDCPEPGACSLAAFGLGGLLTARRRNRPATVCPFCSSPRSLAIPSQELVS